MSSPEAIAPQIVPPPRRVLIVLLGAIGDVVRALPLLGRLRKAWPDAHIAWAVEPKSKAVLERHRWLDEIIVYDRARASVSVLPRRTPRSSTIGFRIIGSSRSPTCA